MKCPKCKNCIPNNCKFCPECGADIRSASISTQSALSSFPRIAKPVEKRKAKSGSELQLNRTPIISKPDDNMREEPRRKDGVQLWAGGPYWADRNIGAERPEDSGFYFWWGDTVCFKFENDIWVASDGSLSNFSFDRDNASTYNKSISTLKREGWITADGVLAPEHDAAHVQWGGDWRMPTRQELEDLCEKCDWAWTTMHGVEGIAVRGRGNYVSASIFLPCACNGDETSLYNAYSDEFHGGGGYWSSVPASELDSASFGLDFDFDSGDDLDAPGIDRAFGLSIRPVQGFTK